MTRFINMELAAKIAAALCLMTFIGTPHAFAGSHEPHEAKTQTAYVPHKSPVLAFVASAVITGAGQAYNGEWKKGAIQFTGSVAGAVMVLSAVGDDETLDEEDNETLVAIGALLWIGSGVWSMIDAPISANRINREAQSAHLFQMDAGPFIVEADPVVRRNGMGGALTLRF